MRTYCVLLMTISAILNGCAQGKTGVALVPSMALSSSAAETGTLTGLVSDASGAVIPGADISVTRAGVTEHVKTDSTGVFTLSGLPLGTYNVAVTLRGFATSVSTVKISAAETARLDVVMRVGSTGEHEWGVTGSVPHPLPPPPPPPTPSPVTSPPPGIPAFPTNPPTASTRAVLPALVLASGQATRTFGDIDTILSSALSQVGYGTKGYWSYPGGFAVATLMEQIYPDGKSMAPPARFSNAPPIPSFFTVQYFKNLFVAQQGYFRIIVFIVTNQPIVESDTPPTEKDAVGWTSAGGNALPYAIASTALAGDTKVTAFIYEFEDSRANDASQFNLLNQNTPNIVLLTTEQHLRAAGLWAALRLP
jgi:Carboxypeptidase regulatory-like domain